MEIAADNAHKSAKPNPLATFRAARAFLCSHRAQGDLGESRQEAGEDALACDTERADTQASPPLSLEGETKLRVIEGGNPSPLKTSRSPLPLSLPRKPRIPRLLFALVDNRGVIDLAHFAVPGLVLFTYPGAQGEGGERDRLRYRSFAALRDSFESVIPGGAVVAASATSRAEQFHQDPEVMWEQALDGDPRCILISDEMCYLAEELGLPTFERDGRTFYERLVLIARNGVVEKVFHSIDESAQDAHKALTWLQLH